MSRNNLELVEQKEIIIDNLDVELINIVDGEPFKDVTGIDDGVPQYGPAKTLKKFILETLSAYGDRSDLVKTYNLMMLAMKIDPQGKNAKITKTEEDVIRNSIKKRLEEQKTVSGFYVGAALIALGWKE